MVAPTIDYFDTQEPPRDGGVVFVFGGMSADEIRTIVKLLLVLFLANLEGNRLRRMVSKYFENMYF